ncbi:hypothetical protein [Actibacterium mucosum]|nr:hypothetical protein [Actibacterium mucosum]
MKAIAEYFRDLAADDRYFGAEPPTPDAEMLQRIAQREIKKQVEARVGDTGIVLRAADETEDEQIDNALAEAPAPEIQAKSPIEEPAPEPVAENEPITSIATPAEPEDIQDDNAANGDNLGSVAARLARIRAVVDSDTAEEAEIIADNDDEALVEDISDDLTFATDEVAEVSDEADELDAEELVEIEAPALETEVEEVAVEEEPAVEDVAEADQAEDSFETSADIAEISSEDDDAEVAIAKAETVAPEAEGEETQAADQEEVFVAELQDDPAPEAEEDFEDDDALDAATIGAVLSAAKSVDADDWDNDDIEESTDAAPELSADMSDLVEDDVEDAFENDEPVDLEPAAIEAEEESVEVETAAEDDATDDSFDDKAEAEAEPEPEPADAEEPEATEEEPAPLTLTASDEVAQDDVSEDVAEEEESQSVEEEAPVVSDKTRAALERARARVLKVKKVDLAQVAEPVAEPVEEPKSEEPQPEAKPRAVVRPRRVTRVAAEEPQPEPPQPPQDDAKSLLSAEDEADLMAELEALRDEPVDAQDAPPLGMPSGDQLKEAAEQPEESVSRLVDEVNTMMDGPEHRRRRSAIAHLKAAVAATVAERSFRRGKSADEEAAEEEQPYRDDLEAVVQPKPSQTTESDGMPPLMLVSEQRIDTPASEPQPVKVAHGNLAVADDPEEDTENLFEESESFEQFAARVGARELPDLLEAAAAYMLVVEDEPFFTRPKVIRAASRIIGKDNFEREDGLRAFGTLLREGPFERVQRGQFTLSKASRFMH